MKKEEFKKAFEEKRQMVEDAIEKYLPPSDARPSLIHQAMRYSMKVGGKRLRPILLLASYELLPSSLDPLPACVAIESMHTYSLIHDDLPAMDNSDLRRGKPTCHKQFDEAMALLAGDALLTFSLWFLAESYKDSPKVAANLVRDLGEAGGSFKMIGGQVEDVLGERDGKMTPEKLNFIHENKTAALITAAITMGIRLADSSDDEKFKLAREIGYNVGMAFQVIDDILDATSDTETMGKTVRLDAADGKLTYVNLYGIEKSREIAADFSNKAIEACKKLTGKDESFLKDLILYMQNRIN
ncbi:polyprenyl synthetase family protein [Intestinicryptomonas porci]|uniref:Polyprenyl synthetase family protein n=1 Tax=Intestinicryptomonas porci TaxID=2926320 RepID=A0ABU4WGD7_9BACT|nr:polyprenyl synthetase family protein [Opitutales bacterium CLA-KB-P66]